MDDPSIGELLRSMGGGLTGYVLAVSAGLVLGCALVRIGLVLGLLKHFRRLGPVGPELIESLRTDWETRSLPVHFVAWFQRLGFFIAVAALIWVASGVALDVFRFGTVSSYNSSWKSLLVTDLINFRLAVIINLLNLGVHFVLGGVANLIFIRARWYVRAGEAIPSREQLNKIETIINEIDRNTGEHRQD